MTTNPTKCYLCGEVCGMLTRMAIISKGPVVVCSSECRIELLEAMDVQIALTKASRLEKL